jgi:iron complex outermembrane recepter protein
MAGTRVRVRVNPWLVLAACAVLLPVPAAAEETQPPKPKATKKARKTGVSMDELVVTARRRPEFLQDTPISLTAFPSDEIDKRGFSRIEEIGLVTPNLQYNSAGGTTDSGKIQIRSIGVSDPVETNDPGVGFYVDDVYLGRAQGQLIPVLDVERIEVLRGPQGTLYGRNTVGGAIKIVSQQPTDELEGSAKVRIGNYNNIETRGILNVPIQSEIAAMRIGFATVTRDGYTENELLDKDTDDRRLWAGRAQFVLNPTQNVQWRLAGDQTRAHSRGRGAQCRYRADALANSSSTFIQANLGMAIATGQSFVDGCNESRNGDDLEYFSNTNSKSNTDTWALNSTLEWETDLFTAKSITGWRRQENENLLDFSFVRNTVAQVKQSKDQQDQVSQEFNFTGTLLDDRLTWTTGLYTFYEKVKPGRDMTFAFYPLCSTFNLQAACNQSFTSNLGLTSSAHAAYGQVTYALTDALRLTGGLRRSVEAKEFSQFTFNYLNSMNAPDPALTFQIQQTNRYRAWTPLANVTYDITPSVMVYFSYSRGFKSGGFNGRPNPTLPTTLEPYEQEKLHNFETGFKSVLLNNRLLMNVNLFRGDYDDIQSTVISVDPGTGRLATSVKNNAEAILSGAEVELRAFPVPPLELGIGLGWTDLHFTRTDPQGLIISPITGLQIDNSELRPNNTPPFEGHATAAYTIGGLGVLGDVTLRATWFHQGRISHGPNSSTNDEQKVGLLSGNLTFALPDGLTEIAFWGENLTDQRYINDGINFEDGFAVSTSYFGAPRMFGMEVRRRF